MVVRINMAGLSICKMHTVYYHTSLYIYRTIYYFKSDFFIKVIY